MKCKAIITLIILLWLVQIAYALPLCEDIVDIHTNCTMVTPSIDCDTYTYDILNLSGDYMKESQSLTQLNGSIYYFNFTESKGEYVVRLCDNTTREVHVKTDEETARMMLSIVAAFIVAGAFFLFGFFYIDKKAKQYVYGHYLAPLKWLCFAIAIYFVLGILRMGVYLLEEQGYTALAEVFNGFYITMMFIYRAGVLVLLVGWIIYLISIPLRKKKVF